MKREVNDHAAFVKGLEAARRMLRIRGRKLLAKGSIQCANGMGVGRLLIEDRIRREKAKR